MFSVSLLSDWENILDSKYRKNYGDENCIEFRWNVLIFFLNPPRKKHSKSFLRANTTWLFILLNKTKNATLWSRDKIRKISHLCQLNCILLCAKKCEFKIVKKYFIFGALLHFVDLDEDDDDVRTKSQNIIFNWRLFLAFWAVISTFLWFLAYCVFFFEFSLVSCVSNWVIPPFWVSNTMNRHYNRIAEKFKIQIN